MSNIENSSDREVLNDDISFTSILFNKLKDKEYEDALTFIKYKESEEYIKHNSLEIVPIINRILYEDCCNSETEDCIEKIFMHMSCIANQKEMLLSLLEEVETCKSFKQFRIILPPLQNILLAKVSKHAKSGPFTWGFNAINNYIAQLPLPTEYDLEGDEKKLLDSDSDMMNICQSLKILINFYSVFLEKVCNEDLIWPEKLVCSEKYFAQFLLQLVHKPLAYVPVETDISEENSPLNYIISTLVGMINRVVRNPCNLFSLVLAKRPCKIVSNSSNHDLLDENVPSEKGYVSQLSLSTYYTFLFVFMKDSGCIPSVYSNEYLYFSCLPCCVYLISEEKFACIHKGLSLFISLLCKIDEFSLSANSLEAVNHSDILHNLTRVLTFCGNKECRILALDCLKLWIRKFTYSGRYRLFNIIFKTVTHAGILGVITHEIKENIRVLSMKSEIDYNFSGPNLQSLLQLVLSLPNGERTDILEWSDHIMSALNLLIYLCLSDKNDAFSYKVILPVLMKTFLDPLDNGLRISKGHYELKLRDINDHSQNGFQSKLDISVGEASFPGLSPGQERTVILQALNWFEIVQSVRVRAVKLVNECLKENMS